MQYIKEPSEELQLQLLAVQQNGLSIQFIKDPSEEVQQLTVRRNDSILFNSIYDIHLTHFNAIVLKKIEI